jgi:hypothetical protein
MKPKRRQYDLFLKFMLIAFGTLIVLILGNMPDHSRYIPQIEQNAVSWIKDSTPNAVKVLRFDAYETKRGGKVCYRVVMISQHQEMTCLGWDNGIDHLATYEIAP